MPSHEATLIQVSDPRRDGLSRRAEARLREKVQRECPSSPWVDAQFVSVRSIDRCGRTIVCRRHDPSVFPPGGAETGMVRCPACGVFTPPIAFENGICLDDREPAGALDSELGWGRSPSAVAIEALQWRNQRMLESRLLPESGHALRREIEQARSKARKAEIRRKRKLKR